MAEALLAHWGTGKFRSLSTGSFPTGEVHPTSLATLKKRGIPIKGYRSKSWDEFAGEKIDIVITVCDNAAGESCPIFPGSPVKAHWGVPDPAKFKGTKKEISEEFSRICDILERRVQMLIHLPLDSMSEETLKQKLATIGTI